MCEAEVGNGVFDKKGENGTALQYWGKKTSDIMTGYLGYLSD